MKSRRQDEEWYEEHQRLTTIAQEAVINWAMHGVSKLEYDYEGLFPTTEDGRNKDKSKMIGSVPGQSINVQAFYQVKANGRQGKRKK